MPKIEVGDVLELYGGDVEVLDWAYKPFTSRLMEAAEYLLLTRREKDDFSLFYLDGHQWQHGWCRGEKIEWAEHIARQKFLEKAERNNFAIRQR